MKQVGPLVDRLNAAKVVVEQTMPKQPTVMLKAIRREALPGAMRVTLELEGEAPYHDEEIDGPPRVFLDLQNTRPAEYTWPSSQIATSMKSRCTSSPMHLPKGRDSNFLFTAHLSHSL